MLSLDDAIRLNADQIWQPLSPSDIDSLWHPIEQQYPEPSLRWPAYCNALCLKGFLDWVVANIGNLATSPKERWLSQVVSVLSTSSRPLYRTYQKLQQRQFISYLVGHSVQDSRIDETPLIGVRITLHGRRLALIPCEAIEPDEFCIPERWVDTPELAADYYLAIALNLDDHWLRVYGYASHDQIKQKAVHDPDQRLYSLAEEALPNRSLPWLTTYLTALAAESARQPAAVPESSPDTDGWATFLQDWFAFGRQIWQGLQALADLPQPALVMAKSGNATLTPAEYPLILGDHLVVFRIIQKPTSDTNEIELSIAARVRGDLPLPGNLQVILAFHDETGNSDTLEATIAADAADPMVEFPELLGLPGAEFTVTATLADLSTTQTVRL